VEQGEANSQRRVEEVFVMTPERAITIGILVVVFLVVLILAVRILHLG